MRCPLAVCPNKDKELPGYLHNLSENITDAFLNNNFPPVRVMEVEVRDVTGRTHSLLITLAQLE